MDFESWKKVEKIYVSMRLYNIMFMNWLHYVLGPVILSIGLGIVMMLYISVTPSGMPPLIHYWIPVIAFGAIMILSWLWYDVVAMKREGDEVMEGLRARTHKFLWDLKLAERKRLLLKARALKPAYFTIGQFTDMTLEGLVAVWDEILNQFLFLLSL